MGENPEKSAWQANLWTSFVFGTDHQSRIKADADAKTGRTTPTTTSISPDDDGVDDNDAVDDVYGHTDDDDDDYKKFDDVRN